MKKYIENVMKFLEGKYPKKMLGYCYEKEIDTHIISHSIDNLFDYLEFQKIVYENLFNNDIYNVYFDYKATLINEMFVEWSMMNRKAYQEKTKKVETILDSNYYLAA